VALLRRAIHGETGSLSHPEIAVLPEISH